LISDRWILSAAHCTTGRRTWETIARLGVVSREHNGLIYEIIQIINHVSYDDITRANDISLAQTRQNIDFNQIVSPAVLGAAFIGGGFGAVVSGWGITETSTFNLQSLNIKSLTNNDCRARLGHLIVDGTLCTFNSNAG
jgi:trypsin